MKDPEVRESFIELRASGWSFAKIAEKLGVSKQTLISWSKDSQTEISNLKAIELDALQSKYCLVKTARIEFLGKLLHRVQTELDGRCLDTLPSEKLVELALKLCRALDEERQQTKFIERRTRTIADLSIDSMFSEKVEEWVA